MTKTPRIVSAPKVHSGAPVFESNSLRVSIVLQVYERVKDKTRACKLAGASRSELVAALAYAKIHWPLYYAAITK